MTSINTDRPMGVRTCATQPESTSMMKRKTRPRASIARYLALAGAAAVLLVASGCASVQPKAGFSEVQHLVRQRASHEVKWKQGGAEDSAVAAAVSKLLKDTLTMDEAVQIGLLNNPALQARYESLGMAQADLVQAGLLSNPVFSASYTSSSGGPSKRTYAITQDFLSLFTLAPRKQVAGMNFDRNKLEVANAVLDLAAQVKVAHYTVEGDEQALELFRQTVSAAEAAAEFAQRQYQAGTLSKREQRLQQAFYAQTLLDVQRTEMRLAADREALNRLLGLWGVNAQWQVPKRMPEVPEQAPGFERLESLAISQRYDVAALIKEREAVGGALGFTRNYRFLTALGIGYGYEKDSGEIFKGPTLDLSLPLFDRSQASIARLESQLRQTERRLEALAVDVRADVREAHARLVAAHASVQHYQKVVLPTQQDIVEETLKFYNGMLMGVYDLVRAKQDQVAAGRDYIAAIKEYWLTTTGLERAVGGRLPGAEPTKAAEQPPAKPMSPSKSTESTTVEDKQEHHH
jgi:outer membrane protein, heavy metal efflux system